MHACWSFQRSQHWSSSRVFPGNNDCIYKCFQRPKKARGQFSQKLNYYIHFRPNQFWSHRRSSQAYILRQRKMLQERKSLLQVCISWLADFYSVQSKECKTQHKLRRAIYSIITSLWRVATHTHIHCAPSVNPTSGHSTIYIYICIVVNHYAIKCPAALSLFLSAL